LQLSLYTKLFQTKRNRLWELLQYFSIDDSHMATFLLACQAREHASCSCCHDYRAAPVCCGNLHIQHTATFSEVSYTSFKVNYF